MEENFSKKPLSYSSSSLRPPKKLSHFFSSSLHFQGREEEGGIVARFSAEIRPPPPGLLLGIVRRTEEEQKKSNSAERISLSSSAAVRDFPPRRRGEGLRCNEAPLSGPRTFGLVPQEERESFLTVSSLELYFVHHGIAQGYPQSVPTCREQR